MNHAKSLDVEKLRTWVGKQETVEDLLDLGTVRRVSAFFDGPSDMQPGDPIGETWHWCFFHPALGNEALGHDGHPTTGGFLPPFDLPRRMWGGSRLDFFAPLKADKAARRTSRVASVDLKQGKSGALGLVTVEHEISQGGTLCRREAQDIVYRAPVVSSAPPAAAPPCPDGSEHERQIHPDPVMLFRYSALTYNAHRIHYDRAYAQQEEGYDGLVVQGPLTATLLSGFARSLNDNAPLAHFEFRGTSPLLDGGAFRLNARADDVGLRLWAERPSGGMAMSAKASF